MEAKKLKPGAEDGRTRRLYYEDSHMREFDAQVLDCRKHGERWLVRLDQTAFFPEGGGQCADTGVLTVEGGEQAAVYDVQEREGEIVHETGSPLEVGSTVHGILDWEQRFSNMQQHTGEHIVSGLVHRMYGYDNVGFHLGRDEVTMDFNGLFPEGALEEIEEKANKAVWDNLAVLASFPDKEELERIEYRSKLNLDEGVRIVTIPGVDACACCAPHVSRTGEIGCIKIADSQHYKGGTRVTILCGTRALADYQKKQESVRKISILLSAKQEETAKSVGRMKEELGRCKEAYAAVSGKLACCQAEAIPYTSNNICLFEELLEGKALRRLAGDAADRTDGLAAVFSARPDGGYDYILAGKNRDVREVCRDMNERFAGRGGGSAQMAQGCIRGRRKEIEEYIYGI